MFETRREIREAVRRKIRAEGRRETIALLERRGISVPPEITSEIERLPENES